MGNEDNTNWGQSVAGIVMKEDKVLLARHTYGAGKGKLIIPGGYVKWNETPQEAVKREVLEETGISVEPTEIVAIRFNLKDWYVVFLAEYIDGIAHSDNDENSEVVWLDLKMAMISDDVPELTEKLLKSIINNKNSFLKNIPYEGNTKYAPYSLYGFN